MLPAASLPSSLPQPFLFALEESTGRLELYPAVWGAVEDLTKPEPDLRRQALVRLVALNAPRLSPLVAYVLATRLIDPDIETRTSVIRILGDVLSPDENGFPAPEEVRNILYYYLSHVRTRTIFGLLQVTARDPSFLRPVERILNSCPYAGTHLTDILTDSHASLEIRQQAVILIGQVGYLDALSALEKIETRLEARLNGQKTMPFAPLSRSSEGELLPAIRVTLNLLRSP
jgi:hypothetical protein